MNQYFELIEIKSEADLPKEKGSYTVVDKTVGVGIYSFNPAHPKDKENWILRIQSYFSPIEVEEQLVMIACDSQDENLWGGAISYDGQSCCNVKEQTIKAIK